MRGTPFGRYLLIEQLGQGGMGEVWRAHDTRIDRTVAIKMLLPHFAKDHKFEQRFRREARAAARLDDPHVVPIHDVGEIDGRLYVTMRLIDGKDLQTLLEAGPLQPQRAVAIVEQVAKALHAAHKTGLVHRDIKPSNILVAEDDFAYLIDFGIARAAGEAGLTSTGATIGTWSYMAPERFTTGQAEASSDIYALACVLYECLTGELPFPSLALEQIVAAHLSAPPPRPSTQRPGIPTAVDAVIATGLAKDPGRRFPSTTALAAAARNAVTTPISGPPQPVTVAAPWGGSARPPPPSAPTASRAAAEPKRGASWRRKGVVIPAAVLAAALVVVATILLIPDNGSRRTGTQLELPFDGLTGACGVAVDKTLDVFVIDNTRVLKLPAGSTQQQQLPFSGLSGSCGVAVDDSGAVYVADTANYRVLKLPAGSTQQQQLPFTGLTSPYGVAVDEAGAVYVTDTAPGKYRVLKLAAGSNQQEELPLVNHAPSWAVAVGSAGNVYLNFNADIHVLKFAAGPAQLQDLPFSGLTGAVTVDHTGAVYAPKGAQVLKVAAGSSNQEELPFTGLNKPYGVAVDGMGNVYVTDNGRVLKLLAP